MRLVIGISATVVLTLAFGLLSAPLGKPASVLAQAPDSEQKVLAELKGIRATLSRLVELGEAADKSQRAAVALQQVQVYDNRLKTLRTEQSQLASQEWDLNKSAAALSASLHAVNAGIGANGLPLPEGVSNGSAGASIQEQSAAATRALQEVHERQRAVEQEIAALRSRIAEVEKFVGDVVNRR
jgi:predicted  nucleic acid-binding Zn-ribbon protein